MTAGCVQTKQTRDDLKPKALHSLLNLVVDFKHLLCFAEHIKPSEKAWAQLLEESAELRKRLSSATYLAEEALGGGELISSLKIVAYIADIVEAWPAHPKRKVVLKLLEHAAINPRIGKLIDKTLSEHSGNLLSLLNLDLRSELVVMLEVQVERLIAQLRALEQCRTGQEKLDVLRTLAPLERLPVNQLEHGPLTDGVLSVNDLELTVSAVAVLALLRPA